MHIWIKYKLLSFLWLRLRMAKQKEGNGRKCNRWCQGSSWTSDHLLARPSMMLKCHPKREQWYVRDLLLRFLRVPTLKRAERGYLGEKKAPNPSLTPGETLAKSKNTTHHQVTTTTETETEMEMLLISPPQKPPCEKPVSQFAPDLKLLW